MPALANPRHERPDQYLVPISAEMFIDLQHVLDRFAVIAQRKALKRAGFPVQVERGEEWWMRAR